MVTKQEITDRLKLRGTNLYFATDIVMKYLLQKEVSALLINSIVEQRKIHKGVATTVDLYRFFYTATHTIVDGTVFGKNQYASMQFMKSVWNQQEIQNLVIGYIRKNGYTSTTITEEQKEEMRVRRRKLQLANQAIAMRVGRAKKRAEKMNDNTEGKVYKVVGDKVVEVKPQAAKKPTVQANAQANAQGNVQGKTNDPNRGTYKGKTMTAEEQAHIDRLKRM